RLSRQGQSRHQTEPSRRLLMTDIVEKVFSGWRPKIPRAADASDARRREGPNPLHPKSITDVRSGVEKRRSSGEVWRSTFARFLGLFDFRLLQQYRPEADVGHSIIWCQARGPNKADRVQRLC